MTLRPILTALFITLIALPAAAQTQDCTPDSNGNVPAGCPAGVALDP
ncbi:hypothetical protein [Gymnodinialimonas hymeniacidonis]